jgi:plastocyanin
VVLAAACNSLVSQFSLTCASVDVSYLVAVGLDVIDPPTLTVQQGDIVCWEAVDGATHPLISSNGTTLNGTADQFEPYVDTLTALGTFAYHCVAHEADGETATITVEPADPEE